VDDWSGARHYLSKEGWCCFYFYLII
jgi:hypothetical protein